MNLINILRGNAVFTALCAATCLAGADWLVERTALPNPFWAIGLGVMLASFVPMLLLAAAWPKIWLVKAIIALDWAYVIIATLFFSIYWSAADAIGLGLILVSTSLVAMFALLQIRGLSEMKRGAEA